MCYYWGRMKVVVGVILLMFVELSKLQSEPLAELIEEEIQEVIQSQMKLLMGEGDYIIAGIDGEWICQEHTTTQLNASNNRTYIFHTNSVSYEEAKTACENQNGLLASSEIEKKSVQNELRKLLQHGESSSRDKNKSRKIWVGLQKVKGTWRWSDGSNGQNSSMWGEGEPNGEKQKCVSMPEDGFTLHDARCRSKRRFLCEIKTK